MDGFAQGLLDDVKKVTKKWFEQSRREIRDANARAARRSAFIRARHVTVQDAAWEIMEDAYLKASGRGRLPVKPRQIMYAARGYIQQRTGKKLDDRYFCQTILPDYCAANPERTASWDIVWDARGNLIEPHTNRQVPLGTLEVRAYVAGGESRYLVRESHGGWKTCGPDDRFGAVLFVEKEGFMPLFRAVKLAERYDLAIMSTKGLSTTAARQLVDHLVGEKKVPVFCIRDFDLDGFKIAGTLREGTRRYSWRSRGAIDLGLRGEDIETWALEREEVFYRGAGGRLLDDKEAIRRKIKPTLLSYGGTAAEVETLLTHRVELNAFPSDQLVEWIEGKLEEHGVKKVIPNDEVLLQAARGFARDAIAARYLEELRSQITAEVDGLKLDDFCDDVADTLADTAELAWDDALKARVRERLENTAKGGLIKSGASRQHGFILLKNRARGGALAMSAAASAHLEALLTIPAIAQMAAMGPRFVTWKNLPDGTGKRRKIPLQADGKSNAKSNDPATWSPYEALARGLAREGVEGAGVVLGQAAENLWLVGVDLDLALSPTTGELQPWAKRWVDRLATYGEVSPSGAGVKLFGTVTQPPAVLWDAGEGKFKGKEATPPDAGMPEGAEGRGHDTPEIGVYPCTRYFTFTGRHLPGTPAELADITESFAELADAVMGMVRDEEAQGPGQGPQAEVLPIGVDLEALPAQLRGLVEADPKLADSWAKGTKLTKGRDASASGLEFSLVAYLAWREHDDELIEMAVRHYPYGQIGSGKLTGGNAARRLDKLLKEAEKTRKKAQRWRESEAWYQELQLSEEGTPRDCLANGSTILNKDPAFVGKIRFDEHRGAPICRDMPWRQGSNWREWTNTDDIRLAEWCQLRGVPLRPTTCADAVMAVADDNRFHPIRSYLDGLVWDGTPRLDGWLETYLGARVPDGKTNEERAKRTYIREVSRRWLISAVARVYKPGCKADCALILEGTQGVGKSSALAALVPNPDWFADEISDLGSKDSAQDLRGKWIIELAELSAMKRGDIERTKAFMSRAVDHYRPSYGRRSQDFPRQCVFAGTTNADAYFGDETGNRRFWPVKAVAINLDALREVRDQLWAEAVVAFKAGEKWWLSSEAELTAAVEQDERRIVDPWEQPLMEWARRRVNPVTTAEALSALGVPQERHTQVDANRISRAFKANGWEKVQHRVGHDRVRAWSPARVSRVEDGGTFETRDTQTTETAAIYTPVTDVTSVTGRLITYKGTPSPFGASVDFNGLGGGVPTGKFSKNGCDTRDTRDTPAFTPTAEWQEVPEDAVLPPGLEIRMSMDGGPNFARLRPEPEGEDVW